MTVVTVVPAYRPGPAFLELLRRLLVRPDLEVVAVDDGSGEAFRADFDAAAALPRTTVLRHAVNLGKGAALKTAFNHLACRDPRPDVVVTADADGQHLAADIFAVAERAAARPDALVLGVRRFEGDVPFRSRLGNRVTRILLRTLVGLRVTDTQTGLRAVPTKLLPRLLVLRSNRYELELDMLLLCRRSAIPIEEVPIATVYVDDNQASHFNPLLDSMRIYLVLFRFTLASLLSAIVDFAIFFVVFAATAQIGLAQVAARAISMFVNYAAVRDAVFHDRRPRHVTFTLYFALVCVSGLASYALMRLLSSAAGMSVLLAKPIAESLVYFANFAIQREFIFRPRTEEQEA